MADPIRSVRSGLHRLAKVAHDIVARQPHRGAAMQVGELRLCLDDLKRAGWVPESSIIEPAMPVGRVPVGRSIGGLHLDGCPALDDSNGQCKCWEPEPFDPRHSCD